MKKNIRSIYAELYVKGSHRTKLYPRPSRPWRPKLIAWAGPAAFYRNRFYEMDQWYKARITKPDIIPKLHVIDPDQYLQSLEERTKKKEIPTIDIGFQVDSAIFAKGDGASKASKEELEKRSRNLQLRVDLKSLQHSQTRIFNHFRVFDDLFGPNVVFHNTQKLKINYKGCCVYHGNILNASDTVEKPSVEIESVGEGFSTLLMVNLDGNPYSGGGEIVHWLVSNIEDGKDIETGTEEIPYIQALPFFGSGFHRLTFVLFRHKKKLSLFSFKPKTLDLEGRTFMTRRFYKDNESMLTPSSAVFAQTIWDISVNRRLQELGLKAPLYRYKYNAPLKMEQREFPNKPQPFDLYLDQFRDPVEMQTEVFKKRLALSRVEQPPVKPAYPDINYMENKILLPPWRHTRLINENTGISKNYALWKNPIDF